MRCGADGIVPQPHQRQGSREVEARFAAAARVVQTIPYSYPAPASGQEALIWRSQAGRQKLEITVFLTLKATVIPFTILVCENPRDPRNLRLPSGAPTHPLLQTCWTLNKIVAPGSIHRAK